MPAAPRIIVVGAGIGGLAAAVDLAAAGARVTVIERAALPGGKMRVVTIGKQPIDAGPTVFTMRWVFERLFADAGSDLSDHVTLEPAGVLARHVWSDGSRLDLHADIDDSAAAIAEFAGTHEALRFLEFSARARATYETLEQPFMLSPQPTPLSLTRGAGLKGLGDLWRISPFVTLWTALGDYFKDPRLRQLFARYATYCGSSPFQSPATLMLVADVERQGVWLIKGGMHHLARAVAALAEQLGVTFRYNTDVSEVLVRGGTANGVRLADGREIAADAVVVNADAAAVAAGLLGPAIGRAVSVPRSARSLSAVTWALEAETEGLALARHSVFFSDDYRAEFDDIFVRRRLPDMPTVYVCAQDRDDQGERTGTGPERLFMLVNAPAIGDVHPFEAAEIERCQDRAFTLLKRCGLTVRSTPEATMATTPRDFDGLFPGTGGALYGQASHGWTASFTRPTARTRIPGLYLAGGSTHPGPGVPMAALSGRLAAARVLSDLSSTSPSRPAATFGGTSTR